MGPARRTVQVWPRVFREIDAAQLHLAREPVHLIAFEGARGEFGLLVRQMHDALVTVNWSEVPTEKLVSLLRRFVWATAGVRYLAEQSPKDTNEEELRQFYDLVLIRGVVEEAEGQLRDGENALDLARFAAIGHLAIPFVVGELVRRGKGHKPGVAAAILLGLPVDSEALELDEEQGWAPEYMLRCIRRSFPNTVRGDPSCKRQADPDLHGQVMFTLSEPAWSEADVMQRIVNALDGRMDVAPRAIHDRLARKQKSRRKKQALEVRFEERSGEDGETVVIEPVDRSATSDSRTTSREMVQEIAQLAKKYRALLPYLEARRMGDNQKMAASAAGISDRTARNYDRVLDDLKRRWIDGRPAN